MSAAVPPIASRGNGIIGVLGTISLVLAVFAPIMGITGAINYSNALSLTEHSVSTSAEIVSVERRRTGSVKYRDHSYFTTVAFSTQAGEGVTTELPRTSDQPNYSVGDEIAIAYDSTHPENASLEANLRFATAGGIVMIVLGAAAALAVLIMVLVIRRVFRARQA